MVNGTIPYPSLLPKPGWRMFMNYPQRLRLQRILDSVSQGRHAAGSIEQMVGDFTHRVWILLLTSAVTNLLSLNLQKSH
jgi:hypothetical protein